MENRKYAEAILPHISNQARTIADIAERTGKTKTTVSTYITDCRNRGHDIVKYKRKDGDYAFRYRAKNQQKIKAAPMINLEQHITPDHINTRLEGKTKFIQECLHKKLGFVVSKQQTVLYGLHLADQMLNPEEFDD